MKSKTFLALIIGLLLSLSCAAAATVSHPASQILPGSFQVGSYNFPGILTVGTALFVNASAGNVGIGTTEPVGQLHLAKSNAQQYMYIETYDLGTAYPHLVLGKSNSDTIGTLAETNSGDNLGILMFRGVDSDLDKRSGGTITATQNGVASGTSVPMDLKLETWGDSTINTAQLVLHHDGNVGIGTTSPGAKLSVALTGTANTKDDWADDFGGAGSILLTDSNGGTANSEVGIFGQMAGAGIQAGIGFARENAIDWGTRLVFYTHPASTANLDELSERMRIDKDGNVGIGTMSPAEKLEVNGHVRARSFIAVPQGNTLPTCDYDHRGQLYTIGSGGTDHTYICTMRSSAYVWKRIDAD